MLLTLVISAPCVGYSHVALLVSEASILVKRKLLYGLVYGTQNASLYQLL